MTTMWNEMTENTRGGAAASTADGLTADFFEQLDAAFDELDGQVLVSQSRCVDHLLDLYNATCNPIMRLFVRATLESIRRLNVVHAERLHECLSALAAAANVELAFADVTTDRGEPASPHPSFW